MALAVESSIMTKKKEYHESTGAAKPGAGAGAAGKSSFNSGNSISAGLPIYARNQVKAIAGILERK